MDLAELANGADAGATKPSNPKDIIGSRKLDFSLVPWTAIVSMAWGFLEGALKYGRFNWRIAGVRASIYLSAAKRHIAKYENGQDRDAKTRIHHLDSAMTCLAIMRDAELYGKLEDDRPPCPDPDAMARLIDEAETGIAHLKHEFREHSPRQFTIADTPRERPRRGDDGPHNDGREWGHGIGCPCAHSFHGGPIPKAEDCPTRRRIPA